MNLNVGDVIDLFKTVGRLSDDGLGYTHFSGWLVEQQFRYAREGVYLNIVLFTFQFW